MTSALHPQASASNLQTGARAALFGMLVNLIFAAVKILGGLFGHAYVLIADGIESGARCRWLVRDLGRIEIRGASAG